VIRLVVLDGFASSAEIKVASCTRSRGLPRVNPRFKSIPLKLAERGSRPIAGVGRDTLALSAFGESSGLERVKDTFGKAFASARLLNVRWSVLRLSWESCGINRVPRSMNGMKRAKNKNLARNYAFDSFHAIASFVAARHEKQASIMRVIGDASTLEFAAFKGHFLRDRCFSVIPKLLDNAAGRTDRDNGNIRPIVAPTNGGPRPTRIIVVMLAPHLGVRRATVIPALSPCPSGDVEFYLVTRGKVKATREKRHDKNVRPVPRVIERTEVTCATRVRRYGNLQILFDGKVRVHRVKCTA